MRVSRHPNNSANWGTHLSMTHLRTTLRRVAARAQRASGEFIGWVGVALIAYGLGLIHPALAPITVGLAFLAAARSE